MSKIKIEDGLTKDQRYRLKNLKEYRIRKKEYAKTDSQKEKRREYMRKWRDKNRDKHNATARKSHKKHKHKHIDKIRDYHLKLKYNLSLEDKLKMVENQNNLCQICNKPFKNSRQTHVDHCHSTNKIRGILCHVCNTKLGWYEYYKERINNYLN